MQQDARDRIYQSLRFKGAAVLVLSCVLALGLYLHMWRALLIERDRVDYQKFLEQEVTEKTAGLRTLHAWLETAQEEEKSHLTSELHDELGGPKALLFRSTAKPSYRTHSH